MTEDLPPEITDLIDRPQYEQTANFPVEMGHGWNTLSAPPS